MKILTSILLWCTLFIGYSSLSVAAADSLEENITLTQEEKEYLQKHPTITVGFAPNFEPYLIDDGHGNTTGIYADFYRLITQKLGIEFVYKIEPWKSTLNALEKGEIDLIPKMNRETAKKRGFITLPTFTVGGLQVYASADHPLNIGSLRELKGKRVAYHNQILILEGFLREHHKDMQLISVTDPREAFGMLINDQADAFIGLKATEYLLQKLEEQTIYPTYTLTELLINGATALKPQAPEELVAILSKATAAITLEEKQGIITKWFGKPSTAFSVDLQLSEKEKRWLQQQGKLTYVYDHDWRPFEYENELGQHAGIIRDILHLVASRTGIQFIPVYTKNRAEAFSMLENGKAEMYSAIPQDSKRAGYVNFVPQDLLSYNAALVIRSGDEENYSGNIPASIEGKNIGIVTSSTLGDTIKKKYPDARYVSFETASSGFEALKAKTIDLFIINEITANYVISTEYPGLAVATTLDDLHFDLKCALHKSVPTEAVSIIDKALKTISTNEIMALYQEHTNPAKPPLQLGEEEKEYLQQHREFSACVQHNHYPLSGYSEGRITGISGEILDIVAQKLNITFKGQDVSSYKDLNNKVAIGRCDLIASIVAGQERFPVMKSTVPYGKVSLASAGNLKSFFINVGQSFENHTFFVRFNSFKTLLLQHYPELDVEVVHDLDTIMDKVLHNKNFHYVDTHIFLEYVIQNYGVGKFKLNGIFDKVVAQGAFGVHEKYSELLPIVNKAIANIDRQHLESIVEKYTIKEFIVEHQYRYFWYALAIIVLLTGGLVTLGYYARTLKASRENLKAIVRDAANAIIILDMKGNFVLASSEAAKMFGAPLEELIGKNIADIDANVSLEDIERAVKKVENGMYSSERLTRKKDGSLVPVSIIVKKFFLNDRPLLFCSVHDITELKTKEKALKESQERLQIAMEGGDVGVWDWDLVSAKVRFSSNLQKMLGYEEKGEIEITSENWKQFVHPDDAAEIERATGEIISGTADRLETVCRMVGKDGKTCWLLDRGVITMRDEEGRPLYMRGTFSDITFLKELQMQQESLEKQLQQAQKMEAIGTLAGGIAHDFNNILSVIYGYTEMALDEIPQHFSAHHDLQEVLVAANRAKELVSQILTFSRQSQSEQKTLQPKVIVKEALKLLRSSIPATITIKEDIDENCGTIRANGTQFQQIIMNLCTNAYHAMEDNGGTLTIQLKRAVLSQDDLSGNEGLKPGPYIQLSVRDNGPGIDPDIQKQIFEPYFTTKNVDKGTGMGLALVHGIVENHGGLIKLDSIVGKGTSFSIFFPELAEEEQAPEDIAHVPAAGNEKILFVDDEQLIVNMGIELLSRLGYRVTGVNSGLRALEMIKEKVEEFDLVITDQTMPEMTGSDLAQQILSLQPQMPIILCTGYSGSITPEKALAIGIRQFVYKPILMKDLAPIIREIFDN